MMILIIPFSYFRFFAAQVLISSFIFNLYLQTMSIKNLNFSFRSRTTDRSDRWNMYRRSCYSSNFRVHSLCQVLQKEGSYRISISTRSDTRPQFSSSVRWTDFFGRLIVSKLLDVVWFWWIWLWIGDKIVRNYKPFDLFAVFWLIQVVEVVQENLQNQLLLTMVLA